MRDEEYYAIVTYRRPSCCAGGAKFLLGRIAHNPFGWPEFLSSRVTSRVILAVEQRQSRQPARRYQIALAPSPLSLFFGPPNRQNG